MKTKNLFIVFISLTLMISCNKDNSTSGPDWKLKWSDEFDGPQVSTDNWVYETGDGTLYGDNPGWGNNEKQLYTAEAANSYIQTDDKGNSVLVIEAIQNGTDPKYPYTSARMTTEGKQTFRYGKIEARIKLPYSQGVWPAFWTMGIDKPECGWPGCGEIDIMEMLGNQESTVHGNVHYIDSTKNHNEDLGTVSLSTGKYSDDYHIYSIIWTPDNIQWLVDNKEFHTKAIGPDMKEFTKSHYLLLNLAVGGFWPGYPDETSVFPQKMMIDYVKVYEDRNLSAEAEVTGDSCETMGVPAGIATSAISSTFPDFNDIKLIAYGGGKSPVASVSTIAIDGTSSVQVTYPGGVWGGVYFQLNSVLDMSSYSGGKLVVSVNLPPDVVNFEVKLESNDGVGSLNLLDYPSVAEDKGFSKYTIPLDDFVALGLNLANLKIPFALWNPKNAAGKFPACSVLIDNIRFEH
jgi:beta-glucanase (GH16 family)